MINNVLLIDNKKNKKIATLNNLLNYVSNNIFQVDKSFT